MDRETTCCFVGQRGLPKDKIEDIVKNLNQKIDNLIDQGVTNFISGGSLGLDQIAASLIVAKKEMGKNIRLIFALPYKNQDEHWKTEQKNLYHDLLAQADEVVHVSPQYGDGCIKKRNRYMVSRAAYCICAMAYPTEETEKTIKFARQKGLKITSL